MLMMIASSSLIHFHLDGFLRHLDEQGMMDPEEEFVRLSSGGRVLSRIIQHKFNHPLTR
jgi:hypothetical protein